MFGRWHPLAEAASHAPDTPGIFQVRQAKGLIDYPRGKSAMLYYGCAEDLGAAIDTYASRHSDADWLCRHTIEMTEHETDNLSQTFDRLVGQFELRFGLRPTPPS